MLFIKDKFSLEDVSATILSHTPFFGKEIFRGINILDEQLHF